MITSCPLDVSASSRGSNARRLLTMIMLIGVVAMTVIIGWSHRADASSCSGPITGGEIRVIIVVDGADIGGGSSATCLVVPAGTTGSQLLARRSAELGTGAPRYGSSGLLCAIDGLPAAGCGDRNAGGYAYWAYFDGASGNWNYGSINPFAKRLSDGAIEGWRYVRGTGTGQDPPPRIAPSGSLFPVLARPAPEPPSSPPLPPDLGGATRVAPQAVAGETNSAIAAEVSDDPMGSSVTRSAPANAERASVEPLVVESVALASSTSSSSTAGRWIGIVAVAVLITVMAVGAWVQTRRSR